MFHFDSRRVRLRSSALLALFLVSVAVGLLAEQTPPAGPPPTLVLNDLGKGSAPLNGPWQFHVGDDPSWASPGIDDATGHNGWEQVTADKPIGLQGHAKFEGYGWYRKHLSVSPAPGASADFALWVRGIDDIYEIYWNGMPVGHLGKFPPHFVWYTQLPPQTYGLGPIRSGVLAIKIWKGPLASNDDGTAGGFQATPVLGSPDAIATLYDAGRYRWLRGQQFHFGLTSLYTLVALLSLIAWLRDRRQWLLFWMTIYALSPLIELLLQFMGFHISNDWLTALVQSSIQVREVSQWFVLLWLLQLHENPRIARLVRWIAIATTVIGTLDGTMLFWYPNILGNIQMQIADAILTFFILPQESIPALFVAYAVYKRKRLDSARWAVAIFAFTGATFYAVSNIAAQGVRFTHWTLANSMGSNLFVLNGNQIRMETLLRTLLFLSIVYAVIRYSIESRRRQAALEQEFQNAKELQQVLVPETLPSVPGFTLTSAYLPAQEVGGDFFQIIPLEDSDGISQSTLVVLGDVSGKGLRAAMAVSLIVGTVRALADSHSSPAQLLTQLNRRLFGRMQGGFATCVVLRLDPNRECTVASAGHPAPFLNDRELNLPGALPLGLSPSATYEEATFHLQTGDHFALYTDGLLEARNTTGELYGFARLESLFATKPSAAQASQAAVIFGQDDDITVLTLTRLATGETSSTTHNATALASA